MSQSPQVNPPKPDLHYPFRKRWAPEQGQPYKVAEGVYWLRMPLPMSLDHINLWLLQDDEGWVIVDTGVDHEVCKAVWESVFEHFLTPEEVNYIVVTHFHMDHIGLASWLAIRCDCQIKMTRGEFGFYRDIITRDQANNANTVRHFFHSLGFSKNASDSIVEFFKADKKPQEARVQTQQVSFIKQGDILPIGLYQWQIEIGNGHSPEHACLYCKDHDLMISGDQSLPRISSNVSVFPGSAVVNPLKNWLDSCEKLLHLVPETTLVLPAHQEPFRGNPTRMQMMIDEHIEQLHTLKSALSEPLNAIDARKALFNRELDHVQKVLATGETMAHLRYLVESKQVTQTTDDQGVLWFKALNSDQ